MHQEVIERSRLQALQIRVLCLQTRIFCNMQAELVRTATYNIAHCLILRNTNIISTVHHFQHKTMNTRMKLSLRFH
jgi:hypothetical protein